MKKMAVFTLYDDKGASSQYRAFLFKKDIDSNFDTKWYYFWDNGYVTKCMHNKKKYVIKICFKYTISAIKRWYQLNFVAPKMDIIFVQKACIPKMKNHFLNRAKRAGTKIIFDVDDAVYLNSNDNSNEIAKASNIVICGNMNLYNHYLKYNSNTYILPTVENTLNYEKYWKDTFSLKTIGWIGSKTTIDNLDLIVEPINSLINKHPEVRFCIISDTALDYPERISNCSFIKWDKNTYIEELSKFTIGIMPLKDNEYNHGKCGFKLIQYLNMKKPVIGSDIGVNGKIINKNGLIIHSERDWENAFETLLFDRKLYNDCINEIENSFFKAYHYNVVCKKLIKLIDA